MYDKLRVKWRHVTVTDCESDSSSSCSSNTKIVNNFVYKIINFWISQQANTSSLRNPRECLVSNHDLCISSLSFTLAYSALPVHRCPGGITTVYTCHYYTNATQNKTNMKHCPLHNYGNYSNIQVLSTYLIVDSKIEKSFEISRTLQLVLLYIRSYYLCTFLIAIQHAEIMS